MSEVVEMDTKQLAIILFVSASFIALLGCVKEQPPAGPECAGEGESVPAIAEPPECCAGLTLIPPMEQNVVGISGYCTAKCGNGTCDQIESQYNCPEDCEAETQPLDEQVVGPDYYDSEQDAFDALGGEADAIPDVSPDELEALIGG